MTVNEAAERWGMTNDAVRKLIRRGRVPSEMVIEGGRAIYLIPDGTIRPEKDKPGVKPGSKRKAQDEPSH